MPETTNSDGDETLRPVDWDFDTVVKAFTAAGVVVYALLFVAYREYYSTLRIAPEDVGVGNTYVLVRSMGFVALTLTLLALVYAMFQFFSGFASGPITVGDWLRWGGLCVAGGLWAAYLDALTPADAPGWVSWATTAFGLTTIALLVTVAIQPRWKLPGFALLGLVIVTVPAVLLVVRAHAMANTALRGDAVRPYSVLGIPTLDVAAPRVDMTWVGPEKQMPEAVFADGAVAQGVLIGSGSQVAIVGIGAREGLRLVRLPISQVALTVSVNEE